MFSFPASLILGIIGLFTDKSKFPATVAVVIGGGLVLLGLLTVSGSFWCD